MRTSRRLAVLLAFAAAVGMTTGACNKSDDSSNPPAESFNPVGSTPVSGGQPEAPPQTVTPGVTVEVLSSNFEDDRCTQLKDPKYAGLTELTHTAKLTNNSGENIYSKVAIFHSPEAGCGATGENPGGTTGLVTGDTAIDNGKSGTPTYHFHIGDNMCGRYQLDDTWKPTNTFVIGKVIDTGVDCPDCGTTNVQVNITGQGLTRTVTVTFKGEKPNKKATVDFGDGTSDQFANGESKSHTFPYGSFTVSASLNVNGLDLPCTGTAVVSNERPDDCEDVAVRLSFAQQAESVTAAVASSFGVCFQGSWVNPGTGSLDFGDASSQGVSNPFTQCHNYTQTTSEQNFTAKLTVVRGQLTCPATLPVKVPPKQDTCDNYEPPPAPEFGGALALENQTATQVTVKPGTVSPSGGSFNPTLPATVNRPAYGSTGSFETTYTIIKTYGPENLRCQVKFDHEYSITLPPRECPKENIWTIKNQRNDGPWDILIVTNKDNPAGSVVESFSLGAGQSASFDGYNSQTLHAFYKLPKMRNIYWYDFNGDLAKNTLCIPDGGTWYDSIDGRSDVCATPNNHGNTWGISGVKYKTTQEVTGYEYHFADSETSGACGPVNTADFEAQWVGDAKLSVSCVCPTPQ